MHRAPSTRFSARPLAWASLVAVTLLIGWGLLGESAQARLVTMLVAQPTAVATVDIDSVLSQLDERSKLETDLASIAASFENEVNALKTNAEELAEDVGIYEPGTDGFKDARHKAEEANLGWRMKGELANRRIAEEHSELQRTLYIKIMAGVRAYAEAEGWDIVLIDDSAELPPYGLTSDQFSAFVSTRTLAFRTEAVDISDAVATTLNNAFRNNMNP